MPAKALLTTLVAALAELFLLLPLHATPGLAGPQRIPAASPSVAPKIETHAKTPLHSPILSPNDAKHASVVEPTGFVIFRGPGNELFLKFASSDAHWSLDATAPLAIQLNAEAPQKVVPAVITRIEWKKTPNRVPVQLKGSPKSGQRTMIFGKAAYQVCDSHAKPVKCRKTKSLIMFRE